VRQPLDLLPVLSSPRRTQTVLNELDLNLVYMYLFLP